MDTDIIATLIQENDELRKENDELRKENDELSKENDVLLKNNDDLAKDISSLKIENHQIKKELEDEIEISTVLSRRIHIIEQDFRQYVEKMNIYLSYKQETYNEEVVENDEILYEKPQLSRSTNLHEWSGEIYPLEI